MESDFEDFLKSEKVQNTVNSASESDKKKVEEIYNKYKDMGQIDLISALIQEVNNQKKNGTFSKQKLENYLSIVSPMLNQQQQDMMRNILNSL